MKTLVFQLQSEATDTSIPKLGTLRIELSRKFLLNNSNLKFILAANTATRFSLLNGNGKLSTQSGVVGVNSYLDFTTGAAQTISVYPQLSEDDVLVIENPENLLNIGGSSFLVFNNIAVTGSYTCKIKGLRYAVNNTSLYIAETPLMPIFDLGDLLMPKCTVYLVHTLYTNGIARITGDVSDMVLNETLTLNIFGQLSSKGLVTATLNRILAPKCTSVYLRGIDCFGDVSQIITAKNIVDFRVGRLGRNDNSVTWSTASKVFDKYTGSQGFIIYQSMGTTSIDNALKSLSLTDFSTATNKSITLYGTRSSSSDVAVTTLTNAGVTVTINAV